jgi:hypothetical protein
MTKAPPDGTRTTEVAREDFRRDPAAVVKTAMASREVVVRADPDLKQPEIRFTRQRTELKLD